MKIIISEKQEKIIKNYELINFIIDEILNQKNVCEYKEMGYNCPPLKGGKKQRKSKTTIGRRNMKSTRKNNSSRKNSNKTWGRRQ